MISFKKDMCKKTMIANSGEIQITQCSNCKMINVWKPGLLLSFSFNQFYEFTKVAKKLNFDKYFEYGPDGNRIVILSTPFPDICLKFTRAELNDFVHAIDEAMYMHKVYELVHS
ncbi:hypothetical protein [Pedobacter nanyangensis]|uniref:hypothetical protein n=1 Tax=Pedobacter nanyangensis TaxID=1562389 RepID=UPI000DE3C987|nr:hypothetical protein [Pedobacter nanyangensis]